MGGFDFELQQKLLAFVTGSDRIPAQGLVNLDFRIQVTKKSPSHLPCEFAAQQPSMAPLQDLTSPPSCLSPSRSESHLLQHVVSTPLPISYCSRAQAPGRSIAQRWLWSEVMERPTHLYQHPTLLRRLHRRTFFWLETNAHSRDSARRLPLTRRCEEGVRAQDVARSPFFVSECDRRPVVQRSLSPNQLLPLPPNLQTERGNTSTTTMFNLPPGSERSRYSTPGSSSIYSSAPPNVTSFSPSHTSRLLPLPSPLPSPLSGRSRAKRRAHPWDDDDADDVETGCSRKQRRCLAVGGEGDGGEMKGATRSGGHPSFSPAAAATHFGLVRRPSSAESPAPPCRASI